MCASLFLSKNHTNILTNIEKNAAYYSCFMNNRPIVYRYTILEVLMNIFKSIKKQLKFCIKTMATSSSLFVVNPEKDFTRKRKHLFGDTLMNVILLESGSLKDELFKRFGYSLDTPSASSFIQARDKIRPDAFHTLFDMFNSRTHKTILHKGYRLLAVDGSVLPISNILQDEETTIKKANNSNIPFSAYHINTSYDLLEQTYDDVILQGQAKMDENGAFNSIIDRYKGPKAIFIADRGYESINSFVKVQKANQKFLIRVKDIDSKTSVLRSFGPFEDKEFDVHVKRILTTRQTNEIKAHPEIYKFIPKNQRFEHFEEGPFFEFGFRVVRFKISDDTYESIVTNLDENEFSLEEIKELYHMRWGIETSYREIKYDLDLNTLHSKKRNLIQQEIYSKLLLYNFCRRITKDIKIQEKNRKYEYQLNYVRAYHIIRKFLKEKSGKIPLHIESMIAKEILPIRLNRQNKRKVKTKSPVSFNYRYD